MLKAGEIPCIVATSSLELGIDMGAVDLVLQVESPKSVAAGLQRIGRAGHWVGALPKGRLFATTRDDARMIRSNFLISEFWGDETRVLSGWSGHRVVRDDGGWKIAAKQVNLIDCDQSIRNPSIIF